MKIMLIQLQRELCSVIYEESREKTVGDIRSQLKQKDCHGAGEIGNGQLKTIEKELYFRMKVRL